jgi:hypothetical protein
LVEGDQWVPFFIYNRNGVSYKYNKTMYEQDKKLTKIVQGILNEEEQLDEKASVLGSYIAKANREKKESLLDKLSTALEYLDESELEQIADMIVDMLDE